MDREKALKVALVVVGLLFVALTYPLLTERDDPTLQMMLSLYVTMGVFALIASRNPAAHRSLIAFLAWSNLAHAGTMAVQSVGQTHERAHLLYGVAIFGTVGLILLVLGRPKSSGQMAVATS